MSGITPAGVGTPGTVPPLTSAGIVAPSRHTPIPTPVSTPSAQTGGGDLKRGIKREREDSISQINGTTANTPAAAPGVTVSTNGPVKASNLVMNAKAGNAGVRPRPVKKQRMVRYMCF
jgi:hypothetical protein